jgi:hypothetical protein
MKSYSFKTTSRPFQRASRLNCATKRPVSAEDAARTNSAANRSIRHCGSAKLIMHSCALTIPLYCAVVFSLVGVALTAKAAPIMLGLACPNWFPRPRHAFDDFFLWGLYLRGTTIALTFIAVRWSLTGLNQGPSKSC